MTIAEALQGMATERLKNAWVSFPGIVRKVDRAKMVCDIQPKMFFGSEAIPYLVEVPIYIIRGGNSVILPSIKVEDVVLVVASTVDVREVLTQLDVIDIGTRPSFSMSSTFVLPGLIADPDKGKVITGTKKMELPAIGLEILSDEDVHIQGPDVRLVSDEGVGVDIDSSAGPGIDMVTTGPVTLQGSILDILQTALKNIKHRTADPAIGDLVDGEINTGLVGGVGKIYFKKGATIYVFNHDVTIT